MTFVIILGIIVGFAFMLGIIIYCIVQWVSLHRHNRRKDPKADWHTTWRR